MNTFTAFARGEANRNNLLMVFDWDKAARRIKEEDAHKAEAGLARDWDYTGGYIWKDGIVPQKDTYTYLASTWATPELKIDGTIEDCFISEEKVPEEWGKSFAEIYWPESARKIVEEYE